MLSALESGQHVIHSLVAHFNDIVMPRLRCVIHLPLLYGPKWYPVLARLVLVTLSCHMSYLSFLSYLSYFIGRLGSYPYQLVSGYTI